MRSKTKKAKTPEVKSTIRAIIESEYAPLIDLFKSDEESRYYLNGFCIEPHPVVGVCLVATNGHILGAFHHEGGFAAEPVIVRLNPAMLQACKRNPNDLYGNRYLVIDGNDARLIKAHDLEHAHEGGVEMLMTQGNVVVDGTFPEWRKVIPHDYSRSTLTPALDANLLKPFQIVSAAAGRKAGGTNIAPISIKSACLAGACLVTTSRRDFFGVVMPLREVTLETATTPEWARQTEADIFVGPPMPQEMLDALEAAPVIMETPEPDPANENVADQPDPVSESVVEPVLEATTEPVPEPVSEVTAEATIEALKEGMQEAVDEGKPVAAKVPRKPRTKKEPKLAS